MKKLSNVFSIFVKKTLSDKSLDDSLNDLNLLLIRNDVATETADVLCDKIKESFKGEEIGRLSSKSKLLFNILK